MRSIEEIEADIEAVNSQERPFACSPSSHKVWQDWKVAKLKAELLDTISESIPLPRLRELCEAEKDGRNVMLPCKEGTKVFVIVCVCGSCIDCGMDICEDQRVDECIYEDKYKIVESIFTLKMIDGFGKTVFLTPEAVEAAKKEMERK